MPINLKETYPVIKDFDGISELLLRYVDDKDKKWSATNPSIGFNPATGYGITIRSANYVLGSEFYDILVTTSSRVTNRLWFSELDSGFNLINLREIDFKDCGIDIKRGVEDARLFSRDGEWFFTAVMLEEHTPLARMSLFKLDTKLNKAYFIEKYDSWDYDSVEKNWMLPALEPSNLFDFIHGPTGVVKDHKFFFNSATNESTKLVRGGSSLWPLGDGTYLAVTHSTYTKSVLRYNPRTFSTGPVGIKTYTHQFTKYSSEGKIVAISEEFMFNHRGVEFAAGLVEKDGNFIISYGYEDVASCLAVISRETVLNMLKEIDA
jgi:hypothetical protein